MEKKELFERIETLFKYVDIIWKGQDLRLVREDIDNIREIYKVIEPGARLTTLGSCIDCAKSALLICWSYYEREHPKYLESLK